MVSLHHLHLLFMLGLWNLRKAVKSSRSIWREEGLRVQSVKKCRNLIEGDLQITVDSPAYKAEFMQKVVFFLTDFNQN